MDIENAFHPISLPAVVLFQLAHSTRSRRSKNTVHAKDLILQFAVYSAVIRLAENPDMTR